MSDEFKDRRLKYVELPRVFSSKAIDITISAKQHLRACEKLAAYLSKQRPNNQKDFEQNEWLKDFVIKTVALNEKTVALLDYLRVEIQAISDDAKVLADGGKVLDIIRDQSETITMIQNVKDQAVNNLYESRKTQLRENKAIAQ